LKILPRQKGRKPMSLLHFVGSETRFWTGFSEPI